MVSAEQSTTQQGLKQHRIWSPVRMETADSFWILLISTISITVIVTRVSLELSGYPQLGDATYHIAHVLWGGLAMFIALVLPLTFANPYIPWITAVAGGIGAGLFIDEVGKFITQGNDYFFPLAFPIIYAFILVCIWLTLRIRAYRKRDTRTLLYHALEELKQILDNDLDPLEHAELQANLAHAAHETVDVEERILVEALLSFVQNRHIRLAESPTALQQAWARMRTTVSNTPPRIVMRSVLVVSFGYSALNALFQLVTLAGLLTQGGRAALAAALGNNVIVSGKAQYIVNDPTLSLVHAGTLIVAGLLALIATVCLITGREHLGLRLGTTSLAISLLIVNLLSFYFNQIYAILATLGQATLLLAAMLYRWRFLRRLD
jgi:hypothetical protein